MHERATTDYIRILALDPSLSCIGWALMEYAPDWRRDWVTSYGVVQPCGDTLDDKLAEIGGHAERLLRGSNPDILAVEMPVVYRNPATTVKLAQALGVIRWAAHHWTDRTIEIMPGGRLTALGLPMRMKRKDAKEMVRTLVNQVYKLELTAEQHDIADAIAVGHAAIVEIKKEEWGKEKGK